ncbi:RHS repeat domain-containing protein [Streptomyces sp. SBT349]|uniref:RHS repeat domain-containing protein n=1 Tax=Streptomyces sp. SBT349 TaxID=1580539 RepID=UPI003B6423D8
MSLTAPDATPVDRRSYAYRADHHLLSLTEPDGTTEFTVDPGGRVTRLAAPARSESYAYASSGDQLTAEWPRSNTPPTGATGANGATGATGERAYEGRLVTGAGRLRYAYDAAGRTVLRQKSRLSKKPDTWRYTWDAEDRLTSVTTPDGTRWRYEYDPFGRRSAKRRLGADGTTVVESVEFTWQDATLVEQTTTGAGSGRDGTLTWDYNGLHPLTQIESGGGGDAQAEFDRRFYAIVTDLVGTPTRLVDEAGQTAWRADATLWGVPLPGQGGTTQTPLRFPGQYADEETGWHYNHHRHYDPATGRYTTSDPLGLAPSPNSYGYAHNPHTWSDPLGLAAHPGSTPGFRRQTDHRLSQRMHVDADGNVTISGRQQLYVNLSGDMAHTVNFRDGVGEIVAFDVQNSFLDQVRRTAVPQQNPVMENGETLFSAAEWREMKRHAPEISDPTMGDDLYGIPGSMLNEFQNAIIPGSGRIIAG